MKQTAQIQLLDKTGFAKTVLMPGDPLRSKMIADTFFENAVLVNNIRGAEGYTGYYNGQKISVMASGMGIPSMSLYAHELFSFFSVENIIRVGTAGALAEGLALRDIVIGESARTDSAFGKQFGIDGMQPVSCSSQLLEKVNRAAEQTGLPVRKGSFYTTDSFYNADADANRKWADAGSVAVEMETAGLYLTAMNCKKNAIAICTVSDLPLLTGCPGCTAYEREQTFTEMIKLALDAAIMNEEK